MPLSSAALRQSRPVRWLIRKLGVHRVVTVVGLLRLPLAALVGAVLRHLPRSRNLVVLGAPLDRFADNAAYVFLYLSEQCPQLRPVWITGSREVHSRLRAHGLSAELRWSRRGVLACLRAGSFVYSGYRSDINHMLAPGAITVSLWHGIGIKRVVEGPDVPGTARSGGALARLARAAHEAPPDYFLSSTDFVTRHIISPAFGTPPERCWELGYPRNDHLVNGVTPPECLFRSAEQWEELAGADKVVGVFLTWRGDRTDDSIDEELLLQLATICRRSGARLAYKAHYNVHATSVLADNCTLLPSTADLNAYLGLCDVLITDYSSVAADFLLMRRPVIYYMPDLDKFAAHPGFYFAPDQQPGEITRAPEQLLAALAETLLHPERRPWSEQDEDFVRMLWGDARGRACPAVAEALTTATAQRH